MVSATWVKNSSVQGPCCKLASGIELEEQRAIDTAHETRLGLWRCAGFQVAPLRPATYYYATLMAKVSEIQAGYRA